MDPTLVNIVIDDPEVVQEFIEIFGMENPGVEGQTPRRIVLPEERH